MDGKYMTKAEITAAYPDQWVLLHPVKTDRTLNAVGGVVVSHGTDRVAVLKAADALPDGSHFASWYNGDVPDDVVFIL